MYTLFSGFSIVCNFVHNYCSVSLSGFYFGRTAGLFGTFNYEPSLDMMSPARYVMGDVESFTRSWEVGQAVCTTSDNFATLPTNDYKVQTKCKNLFEKSTSEYRACFKQVWKMWKKFSLVHLNMYFLKKSFNDTIFIVTNDRKRF